MSCAPQHAPYFELMNAATNHTLSAHADWRSIEADLASPAPRTLSLSKIFSVLGLRKDKTFNLYSQARLLAGYAYQNELDKGTDDHALGHHIDEVVQKVTELYEGKVETAHLHYLKSLAVLHEILELRDARGNYIWTPEKIRAYGFPRAFLDDLVALAKLKNEPYLNFAHRTAMRYNAMLVKIADLEVNIVDREHAHDKKSETLIDKKQFIYVGVLSYFRSILQGHTDPCKVTPYAYCLYTPAIRALVPDPARLARYWKTEPEMQEFYAQRRASNPFIAMADRLMSLML